jgi:ketosteroid isomerase-like protein
MQAVRNLTRAWIARDCEGMSRWVTDDITELGPAYKQFISGRRSFFAKYRPYFAAPHGILSYRILQPRVIGLSRNTVLVYFRYRMRTRNDNQLLDSYGKESMLLEKNRRGWRVKFIHWHQDSQSTREIGRIAPSAQSTVSRHGILTQGAPQWPVRS